MPWLNFGLNGIPLIKEEAETLSLKSHNNGKAHRTGCFDSTPLERSHGESARESVCTTRVSFMDKWTDSVGVVLIESLGLSPIG